MTANPMKILVYGAGPLGSLFSAKLQEAGHDVALLARGERLDFLRKNGVVLVDALTGQQSSAYPKIVERLGPEDAYDLVLVVIRKNRALEILPVLAANKASANILFLMNNAAGPAELTSALGQERVMMGFPMAAGYRRDQVIYYMISGNPGKNARIPIGESDGQITPRLDLVGRILASMPGFDVELRTDMDAWLKTHVALLMPSIAPAMRAANRDNVRMANTRDLIVQSIRAIREGLRVLRALGCPIVPFSVLWLFSWVPEPILVWGFQKRLMDPRMRIAMFEHGSAAGDEILHLAKEFSVLKRQTSVPTPVIDHLATYFEPETSPLPEGSADIPLDWRSIWVILSVLAAVFIAAGVVRRFNKHR